MKKKMISKEISLYNVRLSYPNLFKYSQFNSSLDKRYESNIILDKIADKDQLDLLNEKINEIAKEMEWDVKNIKIPFKDGDLLEKKKSENENAYILSGKSSPNKRDKNTGQVLEYTKIPVFRINEFNEQVPVTEEDNLIYGGCYVNIWGRLRSYDNTPNPGVCFDILVVSFVAHGDKFTSSIDNIDLNNIDIKTLFKDAPKRELYLPKKELPQLNKYTDSSPVLDDYDF